MIVEIDVALRSMLAPTGAQVRFDLPGPDGVVVPTVSLLLLRVGEDRDARHGGWMDQRDERGQVMGRRSSPRRYRLDYVATAWAADVAAEHALLGAVLELLDDAESVPDDHLTEALRATGEAVLLTTAPTPPIGMHEWAALGIGPRAMLAVQASVRLVRPLQPVAEAPSVIDVGVSGDGPARPAPAPPPPRPTGRIRENADRAGSTEPAGR